MTIRKVVSQDCQVLEDGQIQVRTITRIYDDESGTDVEISKSYHRKVIAPGQDPSQESQMIKEVCVAVHTPERITDYLAALAKVETNE